MQIFKKYISEIYVGVVSSISTVIIITLGKKWLFNDIIIKGWVLLLLIIGPFFGYYIIRKLVSMASQKFTYGDFVNIKSDDRKLMVVRYHTWYPFYVVCKEANSTNIICVREDFLERWKQRERSVLSQLDAFKNINTAVKEISSKIL